MKYAFASLTGNVEGLVSDLGIEALRISTGDEELKEDFILLTYTTGYGEVPYEVEAFLSKNGAHLKGVVCSGDKSYGDGFCGAADVIASQYNVPIIAKIEYGGTPEEIEFIKKSI